MGRSLLGAEGSGEQEAHGGVTRRRSEKMDSRSFESQDREYQQCQNSPGVPTAPARDQQSVRGSEQTPLTGYGAGGRWEPIGRSLVAGGRGRPGSQFSAHSRAWRVRLRVGGALTEQPLQTGL